VSGFTVPWPDPFSIVAAVLLQNNNRTIPAEKGRVGLLPRPCSIQVNACFLFVEACASSLNLKRSGCVAFTARIGQRRGNWKLNLLNAKALALRPLTERLSQAYNSSIPEEPEQSGTPRRETYRWTAATRSATSGVIASWIIAVALVALIAATGTTIAQDKQDSPPPVHNPNDDITFKPFGRPLAIDLGDGNERTLYMLEGSSPQDKGDPGHLTYYLDLALALVPRESPLPGFPAWIQKVTPRENETLIDVRFRLFSPKLKAAAEAKLLSDKRAFFDKKRKELGPDFKVEVLPVPAYQLRVYIQDRGSGLALASADANIRSWAKDITLSFRLNKESLAAFLSCQKEGTLEFTPYYKARADHVVYGRKQTTVNYAVGLKVKELLDHRQRSKLKNEDENTILPILQGKVNEIAREVGTEINSNIVAIDPALITFLHSDTMLVSSCFDPDNTMDFANFRSSFPDYTDQMLAEYLKPYGVTKYQGKTTEEVKGKQDTNEKTKQSGGGIGFSLALGPLALGAGGQKESAERVLNTIYNATGIRLVEGGSKNFYKPAEVRVYKLAEGYEKKTLTQASSVTVTKAQVNSYLDLSPFGQTYDVATVEKSLDKTLGENDHVARLLVKKAELEKALDAELAKVEKGRSDLNGSVGAINTERRKLHDAHVSAQDGKYNAGRGSGMVEWIIHAKKVWGWNCPDGNEINNRSKERDAAQAGADAKNAVVAQANTAIDNQVTAAGTADAAIAASHKEIVRLRGEIDKVTKEILSILER
jgi:hypothetical protein